ncbi:MAG: sigma-70 family RNA polymerase sigma factor [Mycobacteriales bacterium]
MRSDVAREHSLRDYDSFYRAELPGVLGCLYSLTGSWPISEDLAQESFLRSYARWPEVSNLDRPGAWVRRVALNLAASRFRRLAAEARALVRLSSRTTVAAADRLDEDDERFWAAVRSLPRRQGQVVALHYGDDQSLADVAEVLGCAEGTVKAHLHSARKTLTALLLADQGAGQ